MDQQEDIKSSQNKESIIVVQITHRIRPECIDVYLDATIANATATQLEPGNIRFDLLQDSEDPYTFQLYEAYIDRAAQKAHLASTHFATWKDAVKDVFADRSIAKFKAVNLSKMN